MIDESKKEKQTRMRVLLGVGVIVIMVGSALFLSQLISGVRGQILGQYIMLDQSINNVAFDAALKDEISERSDDVDRIKKLLVYRDEIGRVVEKLEKEAKKYGVELRVPSIEKEVKMGEDDMEIEVPGPWREVRLSLVAIGLPEDLLRLLHAVEHESYLMTVVNWRLEVQAPVLSRSAAALMPSRVIPDAPEGQDEPENDESSMEVDVILTTLDNEEVIILEDNQESL